MTLVKEDLILITSCFKNNKHKIDKKNLKFNKFQTDFTSYMNN